MHPSQELIDLRQKAKQRRAEESDPKTPGEGAADAVAGAVGSWRFVIVQSVLLVGWLVWNATTGRPIDPFPFVLLNLLLSFQAAYTAPIIMMSQNRQSDVDRERAIEDFEVNRKAELEIELLHGKVDHLREQEIARLADAVDRLATLLSEKRGG